MCFTETTTVTPIREIDDEEDTLIIGHTSLESSVPTSSTILHQNVMYAPKCLVLVSRLDYPETFRVSFMIRPLANFDCVYFTELPWNNLHCLRWKSSIFLGSSDWKHPWLYSSSVTRWTSSSLLHWSRRQTIITATVIIDSPSNIIYCLLSFSKTGNKKCIVTVLRYHDWE